MKDYRERNETDIVVNFLEFTVKITISRTFLIDTKNSREVYRKVCRRYYEEDFHRGL